MSPYHLTDIPKGVFGHHSKIFEEAAEFKDACIQDNPILQLCELADLVGAIEGFVITRFNISLHELIQMMELNKKAFTSGHRS